MRFRWQKRADEEERHRHEAERRLAAIEADWPKIRHHAGELTDEKNLNGWTSVVAALYTGGRASR